MAECSVFVIFEMKQNNDKKKTKTKTSKRTKTIRYSCTAQCKKIIVHDIYI